MTPDQKAALMSRIEGLTKNPDEANMAIRTGSFDLEIIISVAPEDESVFSEDVIATLKKEVAEMTGVSSPVIYLDGKIPKELMNYLATAI